jgi:transcriptional regulator with XRE-family HTH domain
MTAADLGSTVPRRQLGRYLRKLREDGQITIKVAADALEWSAQKIWRIENGAVAMRSLDVEAMCRVYGASAEVTEALMALARETKARGWWHSYGDTIPAWFSLYVGLESAASRLRRYEPELVPGLLQTKAYTRELIDVHKPAATESDRERLTAVRMERQGLLSRRLPAPPQLDVILNEHVLRRPLRDRQAMAGQLDHLTQMADRPNVSIRVLPMNAGLHAAVTAGAFVVLDFPTNGSRDPEPSTVYSEGLTGALYLDKPAEVGAYTAAWIRLAQAALTEGESEALIKAAAEEYAR